MRKWHTQVSAVVANVGRELSLLKMAINKANADYPSFFLWNELEPRCQQRAAGSLELEGGWLQNNKYMTIGYRQTSNTSRTKSQNVNVSRLVLQLSLRNLLKPGVESRMKMQL